MRAATMRPPASPNMCSPAMLRDVELTGHLVDRGRVEEDGVQADIEQDHDEGAGDEGERQAPLRLAHLVGDVGRAVPARSRST